MSTEVQRRYSDTIEAAITLAIARCERITIEAPDGAEVYAYPCQGGTIVWGVNAAGTWENILRGVRLPDGTDEAVS
jgi:hypothetical protein